MCVCVYVCVCVCVCVNKENVKNIIFKFDFNFYTCLEHRSIKSKKTVSS